MGNDDLIYVRSKEENLVNKQLVTYSVVAVPKEREAELMSLVQEVQRLDKLVKEGKFVNGMPDVTSLLEKHRALTKLNAALDELKDKGLQQTFTSNPASIAQGTFVKKADFDTMLASLHEQKKQPLAQPQT